MNLSLLPPDSPVIIDANIIVYAGQRTSGQCFKLLERCAAGDIYGVLPSNILAEVMHVLMLAEAKESGIIKGSNPAKQLSDNPLKVKTLNRYKELIRDLLAIGLQIEPVIREDFTTALELQSQYGLLTNDALFLAVASRLRITSIASADSIFGKMKGFTQYSPDDIKRS